LDVWAQYVYIDGARYVAVLSNTPGPGSSYTKPLKVYGAIKDGVLYVLEDHLGIRQLVFTGQRNAAGLPSFDNHPSWLKQVKSEI